MNNLMDVEKRRNTLLAEPNSGPDSVQGSNSPTIRKVINSSLEDSRKIKHLDISTATGKFGMVMNNTFSQKDNSIDVQIDERNKK